MLESKIEKLTTAYATKKGWLSYKFSSPNCAGVSDRLYIKNGITIFIEFKRKGAQPRPLQAFHIEKIQAHGAQVFVVDSVEAGQEVFNDFTR